ncbi:MAG: hypothetical protein HQL97_01050 [Magnetococcales bacterium]|nr:hypothetical protein [Magnetococcales bacterium]
MEQITINHVCGHSSVESHDAIDELYISIRQTYKCPKCSMADRNAVKNSHAAEFNKDDERPQLVGSEKQVAWAETIRFNAWPVILECLSSGESAKKSYCYINYSTQDKALLDRRARKFLALLKESKAARWIDLRLDLSTRENLIKWANSNRK